MRISEKMERYGRGETELDRIQVKLTGNSKKIRWTDSNKSDCQHLLGRFLVGGAMMPGDLLVGCGLIIRMRN